MIKVGDTLMAKPEFASRDETGAKKAMQGTVIFVHPQRRFCTLEFIGARGAKIRESFYIHQERITA
ncbi:hypothetical protein SDC9_88560 [bioreactor metagenome]|uniref:Uncharacterized protein n=1 Tax=bioreactor metagenome TaxID=1076179 RepID=A0A644ZLV9_9ZZZZ